MAASLGCGISVSCKFGKILFLDLFYNMHFIHTPPANVHSTLSTYRGNNTEHGGIHGWYYRASGTAPQKSKRFIPTHRALYTSLLTNYLTRKGQNRNCYVKSINTAMGAKTYYDYISCKNLWSSSCCLHCEQEHRINKRNNESKNSSFGRNCRRYHSPT